MAQTAADAAALAGAIELFRNRPDSIVASAQSEAKRNGFEDHVGGDLVTVTYPATTGNFTGNGYLNVVVQRTVPTTFASFFGQRSTVIHTRATAGVSYGLSCFIVLDPISDDALKLENSAHLTGSGCGIQVNSTSPIGADATGLRNVISAPFVAVGGPSVGGLNKFVTAPSYNVPPRPDPMAQVAMPTVPNTCDHGSLTARTSYGATTLSPGTYCGGIDVNGTITLNPGLYILRGGGFSAIGGSNTIQSIGTGVTFLNTAPPAGASYGWGPIYVQAAAVTINLFANTDPASALPGVLFYTDRAAPYMVNLFKAGAVSRMDGTMYFPTGLLKFESGASFTINGASVAYRVDLSQSVDVTFTGIGGGAGFQALRRATVVE